MTNSGPERVSIHNSGYWLRVGVGLAQQIGLHREPDTSKHSKTNCQLRRRTWWVLYVRVLSLPKLFCSPGYRLATAFFRLVKVDLEPSTLTTASYDNQA